MCHTHSLTYKQLRHLPGRWMREEMILHKRQNYKVSAPVWFREEVQEVIKREKWVAQGSWSWLDRTG